MKTVTDSPGITFDVDGVTPSKNKLLRVRTHDAVESHLGTRIESCSDYSSNVAHGIYYQSLLAAVYKAYCDHYPLVLSPDAIWITITQGVAHHMAIHGEQLRDSFVAHDGRLTLTQEREDMVAGSPENLWSEVFSNWTHQIRDHVGKKTYDCLICKFSTTDPVSKTVSQIVMMDIFEQFFRYQLTGICGIPCITLTGTPDDWAELRERVDHLRVFDMDWWLDPLSEICDEFVAASKGNVDRSFWQRICKLREEYGGHLINGWIAKLFPYLGTPARSRNPIFETGEGFQTYRAPSGISKVPFQWKQLVNDGNEFITREMEAIGGFFGVAQDSETLALSPKIGWAVREAPAAVGNVMQLVDRHKTFPGHNLEDDPEYDIYETRLPEELSEFFFRTNGAIIDEGSSVEIKLLPFQQIQQLTWSDLGSRRDQQKSECNWCRFADLNDGSFLAIKFGDYYDSPKKFEEQLFGTRRYSPIAYMANNKLEAGNLASVIALTFNEFLSEALKVPGGYWNNPDFQPYGLMTDYKW